MTYHLVASKSSPGPFSLDVVGGCSFFSPDFWFFVGPLSSAFWARRTIGARPQSKNDARTRTKRLMGTPADAPASARRVPLQLEGKVIPLVLDLHPQSRSVGDHV